MKTLNHFIHRITQLAFALILALSVVVVTQSAVQADTPPSGIVIRIITPTGNVSSRPAPIRPTPEVVVDSADHILPQPQPAQLPAPTSPVPVVCDVAGPNCPNVVSTGTEPPAPKPSGVPIRIIRVVQIGG